MPSRAPVSATALARDDHEWATFVAALHRAVDEHGVVSQTRVRPLIRGRIQPKHIGGCYRRARTEGLLAEAGWEDSTDVLGHNSDKKQRLYRLTRTPVSPT